MKILSGLFQRPGVLSVPLFAAVFALSSAAQAQLPAPAPWAATGTEYMVAADHPLASQAGARILAEGGNAVDAAVAVSFALGIVRPYSTGLGGGGFMMIKNPGEKPVVIDFRERAPMACTPENYLDSAGNPIPGKTVHGYWAVGVPGTLKGMTYVLEHYGTKSLEQVIQPAVELAETGFPVDRHTHEAMVTLAKRMQNEEYQTAFNELYRTFLRDGKPYEIGDSLRRPNLAGTLRNVSLEGAGILYSAEGLLYRSLIQEMQANNGPIVPLDLDAYEIAIREPLAGRFHDYETWTMPPPSSGGAVITEVLNVVEQFGRIKPDLGIQAGLWPHFLVEAMKHAFADRALGLGDWDVDPDSAVHQVISRMTDSATATLIIDDFRPERTYPPEHYGTAALADDHGTSHYCIIDGEGLTVACSETINYIFGSYVMLPGTGVILNDQLDDFSIAAGRPNLFGLVQSEKNLIGPKKRPLSSMSPTIITRDGRPVLVVGGSGGPRIITGVLHVLLNVLEFGMRPDSAVAAPRFHHQWLPDRVNVEPGLDSLIIAGLIRREHRVEEYSSHPGHIQLIARWRDQWFGASDPRKGGRPAGR